MKSPKSLFLENKAAVLRHNELVDTPEFQHILMMAEAEYVRHLPDSPHPAEQIRMDARRLGASEVLRVLVDFGRVSTRPPTKTSLPAHLHQPERTV